MFSPACSIEQALGETLSGFPNPACTPALINDFSLFQVCKALKFRILPWNAHRIPLYWVSRIRLFERVEAKIRGADAQTP